ncbi:MAG: protein kinase [Archangium sp.]
MGTLRDEESRPRGSPSHVTGTVLAGRYKLIRLLGRGGMGEVYEAYDEDLRVRIALKTLRAGSADKSDALEWLKQELRIGRSVAHKNLCRLYDFGSDQGVHFITMELLRGPTLAQHLEQLKRPMTPAELAPVIEQICAGLAELHGRNLVHLDIKPSNVVLEDDRVVVTDFGLAALQSETALGGSPWYMAPEQVERKAIDLRADVFALGVVIYEALTRKLPFSGMTDDEIARARLFMQPLELEGDSAPRKVRKLVSQCLSRDPSRRPQRATDVAARFTQKEEPRSKLLPALVAVVALAATGVGVGVAKRAMNVKRPPRIAVLPFESGLEPRDAWIAASATQEAEAGLSASTDATLVPPLWAREAVKDAALTAPWPADLGETLGRRLDFDVWLTGKVSGKGEKFHLHLEWPGGSFDGDRPNLDELIGDGLDAFRVAHGLKVDASSRAAITRVVAKRHIAEQCALGDLALARYAWAEAANGYDECLQGDNTNSAIALRLADVEERQVGRTTALPVLKNAWEHRDILTAEGRAWVEARYARALGNWSDAVAALKKLPPRAEIRFALAEALAASGQLEDARRTLDAEWSEPDKARAAWVRSQLEPDAKKAMELLLSAEQLATARGQRHLEAIVKLERVKRLVALNQKKEAEDLARAAQLTFRESGDLLGASEAMYEIALLQEARGVAPSVAELRAAAKEARVADAAIACRLDVMLARGHLDMGQTALAKQVGGEARHCLRALREEAMAQEASLLEAEVDRIEGHFTFIDDLAREADMPESSDETRAMAKFELAAFPLVEDDLAQAQLMLDAVLPTVKDFPRVHGITRVLRAEVAMAQKRFDEAAKECELGVTAVHGNAPLEWLEAQLLARKALALWFAHKDAEAHAALDEGKRVTMRGSGEWMLRLTEARMKAKEEPAALKALGEELEKARLWVWSAEALTVVKQPIPPHWGFAPPKFAVRLGQLQR